MSSAATSLLISVLSQGSCEWKGGLEMDRRRPSGRALLRTPNEPVIGVQPDRKLYFVAMHRSSRRAIRFATFRRARTQLRREQYC